MEMINEFCDSYKKPDIKMCGVKSNWEISNKRQFIDTISVALPSNNPNRPGLEEIVSFDTCIELQNPEDSVYEPCMMDIQMNNGQKISCIAVVSGASVLEFFKQSGEYASTVFAELIDEFQNNSVFMGVVNFNPPTSEASIRFTKVKNKSALMWVYGIRLILTEAVQPKEEPPIFDPEIVNEFLASMNKSKSKRVQLARGVLQSVKEAELNPANNEVDKEKEKSDQTQSIFSDIKTYIDNKFVDMEKKVMERMDHMEEKTNKKLDAIIKILENSNLT